MQNLKLQHWREAKKNIFYYYYYYFSSFWKKKLLVFSKKNFFFFIFLEGETFQSRNPVLTNFSKKNLTSPSSESLIPKDLSIPMSPFSTAINTDRRCATSVGANFKAVPKSSIVCDSEKKIFFENFFFFFFNPRILTFQNLGRDFFSLI